MRFGVAGYPPAFADSPYRRDRLRIVEWIAELGLDAFELQMTYGPRTRPETCRAFREVSRVHDVALSVHASYYIVFTSAEALKVQRSADNLKRTFELCSLLGADVVVLHPGSLYREDSSVVLNRLVDNLGECLHDIGSSEIGLFLETAGKRGQFGSVQEILAACNALPGVYPCIDFGHVHARTGGTLRTEADVTEMLTKVEAAGYFEEPQRVHFHYTPIDYGPKGEIRHRALGDRYPPGDLEAMHPELPPPSPGDLYQPRPLPVCQALKRFDLDCRVISETYNSQEAGALELQRVYKGLFKQLP